MGIIVASGISSLVTPMTDESVALSPLGTTDLHHVHQTRVQECKLASLVSPGSALLNSRPQLVDLLQPLQVSRQTSVITSNPHPTKVAPSTLKFSWNPFAKLPVSTHQAMITEKDSAPRMKIAPLLVGGDGCLS